MTTGKLSEFAKVSGRSYKVVGYHYRAGHLVVVDRRRPIRVDFERSLEALRGLHPPRKGAGGVRVKKCEPPPEAKPPVRKPDEFAELRKRLVLRDEVIAQRLIEAPDLSARRSLWYHVPLAWQAQVTAKFRELVSKQFAEDGWKRVSLIAQMESIAA